MTLSDFHQQQGAALAPDGIPLHYGNLNQEYQTALSTAVLMDRSHEGRLVLTGRDRLSLIQRISTNDVLKPPLQMGCSTLFTNPHGRIIDRATVYNLGETALLTTEAGRAATLQAYLQRQIFFNDELRIRNLGSETQLFALHGSNAQPIINALCPAVSNPAPAALQARLLTFQDQLVYLLERKPLFGAHWAIIVPSNLAATLWQHLMALGTAFGLRPAGSLTYNALRILAGHPAVGKELTTDYIPLELGLWDEISFNKGCYTGQEIIARMESRQKLAKVLVKCCLDAPLNAPAPLLAAAHPAGTLTSSTTLPDGQCVGLAVVKPAYAVSGQTLTSAAVNLTVTDFAGLPPPILHS